MGTIRAIWSNWKSVIQICIVYKYLSKLQQPKSKLGQLKQLYSNLGRVRNILKLGTCTNPNVCKPQIGDAVKCTTKL